MTRLPLIYCRFFLVFGGPDLVACASRRPSTEDEELEQRMSRSERGKTTVVSEGLRASWPTILTLLTRDQYGHLVHVPNLKVKNPLIRLAGITNESFRSRWKSKPFRAIWPLQRPLRPFRVPS